MFSSHPSPYAPLPGTTPAPRALFVKRWGTLLEPPAEGIAVSSETMRFYDGAVEALFRASRVGWRLYLIGNESDVAFGRMPFPEFERLRGAFDRTLERFGVRLGRDYTCTEHPEGVKGHRADSVFLLPNTGAFFHAAHNDGIDLRKSWVLADDTTALVAGWRAGVRPAGVRTGEGLEDGAYEVDTHLTAPDFQTLVHELLSAQATALR